MKKYSFIPLWIIFTIFCAFIFSKIVFPDITTNYIPSMMINNVEVKKIYNNLSIYYTMPSYEDFLTQLNSLEGRKKTFEACKEKYYFQNYNEFEARIFSENAYYHVFNKELFFNISIISICILLIIIITRTAFIFFKRKPKLSQIIAFEVLWLVLSLIPALILTSGLEENLHGFLVLIMISYMYQGTIWAVSVLYYKKNDSQMSKLPSR